MITVLVTPNKIHLSGHANTASHGSDIVCSAVSALTLTLIRGLKEIARMRLYESVEAGNVCIEWQTINDTGKGIPKSNWKRIFEPGFTTKTRGWGLGLSLSRRIVEDYHEGKIAVVDSEVGRGTTFRITLKRVME